MSRSADNTITYSFDAPKHAPVDEAALRAAIEAEAGGTLEEAAAPAAKPALEAQPAPQIKPAEDAPEEAPEAQAAKPADKPQPEELRTFKIVVDGQEMEVTEADLKAGHMRHRDYTQKTQKLAQRERELAEKEQTWSRERLAVQQELSQIDQFLRDQNAIQAYMSKAFGVAALSTTPPPQIDPNQPLNAAQVAEIAKYNAEQVRLASQREIMQARAEALRAQQMVQDQQKTRVKQDMEKDIDRHIASIVEKYPVLKKFDEDIEESLIGEAAKYRPTSLEDAKQKLVEAAERRVARIRSVVEEEKKQAAVAAAKLKASSPEKPGGQPVKPPSAKALTLNTKDRKAFLAAAEEDVRAILGQN